MSRESSSSEEEDVSSSGVGSGAGVDAGGVEAAPRERRRDRPPEERAEDFEAEGESSSDCGVSEEGEVAGSNDFSASARNISDNRFLAITSSNPFELLRPHGDSPLPLPVHFCLARP